MSSTYLLLWLEAPLQSWGSDSQFGRRGTLPFPTKSGIYGMFLSALGARGPQIELLQEMADLKQTVISCNPTKLIKTDNGEDREIIDRKPFLMDFQMVGSGYDKKDPWQKLLIPKKRDGSAAVGGGSKMTYRYYLQDAYFAVIQELPSLLASKVSDALIHPVYDLFLGRKNCIPTDYMYRGTYSSQEAAETFATEIAMKKNLLPDFKVCEGKWDGDDMIINDVPIQFGDWKKYRERIVTLVKM